MSETTKAVFLSYASQDAETAKRIADALRAAGVEVWFDQSELVGGDAWDGKIRKQIKECALLIPVISANTQSRTEGYFRLEWRLADQRTHLMGRGRAFLLPVCIDDTKDADADVPDSFSAVQWTRLKGGETPPAFAARVKKLLSGEQGAGSGEMEAGRPRPAAETHNPEPRTENRRLGRLWWALPMFGVAMALVLVLKESRKDPAPPVASPPVVASLTDAQKLLAQVWALYEKQDDATPEDWGLAEDLAAQAVKLESTNADAWAAYAQATLGSYIFQYDQSPQRFAQALSHAERARSLAPDSIEARFALANCYRQQAASRANAEQMLRELVALRPADRRLLRTFASTLRLEYKFDESVQVLERAVALPGGDPIALLGLNASLSAAGRYAEAEAAIDKLLALHPSPSSQVLKIFYLVHAHDDLPRARAMLGALPPPALLRPDVAILANRVWLWLREPERCLAVLSPVADDFLRGRIAGNLISNNAPRAFLIGQAHQLAGRTDAARANWRTALQQVEQRLAAQPDQAEMQYWKARLLACLGETAGAEQALQLFEQLAGPGFLRKHDAAIVLAAMGRKEEAIRRLSEKTDEPIAFVRSYFRASLRHDPAFDPLRGDPRFEALLKEPAAPALSTTALNVDDKSVAVLAFVNLSDDKANEYFSDGISEELLNVLAKVPKLRVAARTSSFYFKGRNEPIPEIAQKLGVAYVVEGSVRKAGNKVRITAQLIKAADGFHVWSETYDRDLKDIFAVQDEIAKNILSVVKGSLLGETELPHTTTTKLEAYTLFLQAQGAFAMRGEANLREAVRLFEAALAIDPDYVPALVGMAKALVVLPNYAYLTGAKAREATTAANKAARRALELDPQNAEAHASIGWAAFQFGWQWSEGTAEVERARDLAPNDSWNWNCLGDCHRFAGDFVQALTDKQRAWELDPLSPNSHWDLSYTYLVAGRYDEAIRWSDKCIALAPHNMDSYMPGLLAAGRAGRLDLMRRTLTATRQNVHEGEGMLLLLEAYGAILEKKPEEARRLLALAAPLAEAGTGSPAYVGFNYLLLGESDQAAVWLRRAYEQRDLSLIWSEIIDFDVIAANPKTRSILDQPQLKELYELRQRNARAGLNKL